MENDGFLCLSIFQILKNNIFKTFKTFEKSELDLFNIKNDFLLKTIFYWNIVAPYRGNNENEETIVFNSKMKQNHIFKLKT